MDVAGTLLEISPDPCRAADDGEEHAVEVHVAEVAVDFIAVEVEGHDRHGEIQGASDHIAFADVGLRHGRMYRRVATARPQLSAVEAVRVQVVPDAVTSPFLTSAGESEISENNNNPAVRKKK